MSSIELCSEIQLYRAFTDGQLLILQLPRSVLESAAAVTMIESLNEISPSLGKGLIILVIRGILHTQLHPGGRGSLSEMLPWVIWRAFRKEHHGCH